MRRRAERASGSRLPASAARLQGHDGDDQRAIRGNFFGHSSFQTKSSAWDPRHLSSRRPAIPASRPVASRRSWPFAGLPIVRRRAASARRSCPFAVVAVRPMRCRSCSGCPTLPEARQRRRLSAPIGSTRPWIGIAMWCATGVLAVVAAVLIFTGKPESPPPADEAPQWQRRFGRDRQYRPLSRTSATLAVRECASDPSVEATARVAGGRRDQSVKPSDGSSAAPAGATLRGAAHGRSARATGRPRHRLPSDTAPAGGLPRRPAPGDMSPGGINSGQRRSGRHRSQAAADPGGGPSGSRRVPSDPWLHGGSAARPEQAPDRRCASAVRPNTARLDGGIRNLELRPTR